VVATACRTDTLKDLAAAPGDRPLPVPLDVTGAAQAGAAIPAATHALGLIDVVANNTGYANLAPVEEISLEDFRARETPCSPARSM
jgi:NADP-dependent 3-hydroxy acid dehydrogenase YdfG